MAGLTEAAKLRLGEKLLRAGWEPQRGEDRGRGGIGGRGESAVPGPGEYDPQFDVTKGQRHFSQVGSSSFQLGTSHLPRKWRPEGPGPCEYDASKPPRSPGRGAVISVGAPRFSEAKPMAPGPAYYSPKGKSVQQSFHLNIQKNWV
mmetsp:Transcript_85947/g.216306  ORF Transcript_85947/g.216306 Transcript_85947/m.216306 type:complete len:146 (-) Transcript_85947:70-507(-)